MALTATDILKIQSAIDAYEKKFPRRASPSAEEALAWRAGKGGRPHAEYGTGHGKQLWFRRSRA